MGAITVEKANHLFWLGRYSERVFTSIILFQKLYDEMIDQNKDAYISFCENLDIENIYKDSSDFCYKYVFDKSNFDSIVSNLIRAYDNAIVLRDEISGDTLCYIDMSLRILENVELDSPILMLQNILDYLYAFWGSVDDLVSNEVCRNIMKCGKYAERLDLDIRFDKDPSVIQKQLAKLNNRINKLKLSYSLDNFKDYNSIKHINLEKYEFLKKISELSDLFLE